MTVVLLVALLLCTILIGFAAVFELWAAELDRDRCRTELAKEKVRNENLRAFARRAIEER